MSKLPEYILDREFDAPRDLVWQAWTDPKLLARWYGPGVETIIHKFDLIPGGEWLNEMKWGENSMLSKAIFTEINKPERLVWHHHSTTDAEWNSVANPKMPDWPAILLTVVTFTEVGSKTMVRLNWSPYDATDAQNACFAAMVDNMGKGWESGFAVMEELLAELQANG